MSKSILVIDDEEAIRKLFIQALESTDCQVETAESGEKGIEKVRDTKFDFIFLDLKMPGLNGVQTLRELRKLDANVPVYVVTAYHSEFLTPLKNAFIDGIQFELLNKPVRSAQIRSMANGILEDAKAVRQ